MCSETMITINFSCKHVRELGSKLVTIGGKRERKNEVREEKQIERIKGDNEAIRSPK
jgi:hypothetical protein